jgi:hypothetical protein
VNVKSLDRILSLKPRKKWRLFKIISRPPNLDRRATLTYEGSPTRGIQWFGVKGKLAPRYIGPFEILEICGTLAYHLQLPPQLAAIHDIFHVSQLKKCIKTPIEIIESQTINIQPDLSYVEHPIKVLDAKERSTRRETIKMYKI